MARTATSAAAARPPAIQRITFMRPAAGLSSVWAWVDIGVTPCRVWGGDLRGGETDGAGAGPGGDGLRARDRGEPRLVRDGRRDDDLVAAVRAGHGAVRGGREPGGGALLELHGRARDRLGADHAAVLDDGARELAAERQRLARRRVAAARRRVGDAQLRRQVALLRVERARRRG